MAGIKELKTRIKSIQSTRKITRAMQLVSAAKMRKSQNAALSSRTYSSLAWNLISNLSKSVEQDIPLLRTYPKSSKVGVLLISSNKGLVGSLNLNLISKLKEIESEAEVLCELIVYGKKAKNLIARLGKNLVADFPKIDKTPKIEDIYSIAKFISENYQTGQFKEIYLVYNHFYSTISQKPVIKTLLPFAKDILSDHKSKEKTEAKISKTYCYNYQFEPKPEVVLNHLLPRIIESQIYQAVLESDASEHSARMIMMKNATDAAGDLMSDLTLTFNQLRQGKITTELSEITAGRIALE